MFKLSVVLSAGLVAAQTLTTYCNLLESKCFAPHGINATKCQVAFANIPVGTVGSVADENTIACRLKYLDDAKFNTDPDACRYAGASGGGRCGAVLEGVCSVATANCNGVPLASYPDAAACTTGLGSIAHQWGSLQGIAAADDNSLECRAYHALVGGTTHCRHFSLADAGQSPCAGKIKPSVKHYCDLLDYNCKLTGATAQFAANGQCNVTARGYPSNTSDTAEATNDLNTLGCREYHAQASKADAATHCPHAGPSGAGVCGTITQAWGSILAAAPCNDGHVKALTSIVSSSILNAAIPVGYSGADRYSTSFDTGKNTQVCRVYHLGVASLLPYGKDGHCTHGGVSGGGACGSAKYGANFCDFLSATCGFGTNASWQYATLAACNAAFPDTDNLTVGSNFPDADKSFDTYECRFYHAGIGASFRAGGANAADANAAYNREFHCSHALRISAGGACGGAAPAPTPAGGTPTVSKAPTAAGAPTAKPNSASAVSVLSSMLIAGAAVFAF
jgi:hypothetical protein